MSTQVNKKMSAQELQNKLFRTMDSGDQCFTRILGYLPQFIKSYAHYQKFYSELSKRQTINSLCEEIYENDEGFIDDFTNSDNIFKNAFTASVLKWSNAIIEDVNSNYNSLFKECILEINSFHDLLLDMRLYYGDDYSSFANRIDDLSLSKYKILAQKVGIYSNVKSSKQNFNYSKLIYRDSNFKTKYRKLCNGSISFKNFIEKELKPQYEFFSRFCANLSDFEEQRLPIFMLAHDLKASSSVKRAFKKNHTKIKSF